MTDIEVLPFCTAERWSFIEQGLGDLGGLWAETYQQLWNGQSDSTEFLSMESDDPSVARLDPKSDLLDCPTESGNDKEQVVFNTSKESSTLVHDSDWIIPTRYLGYYCRL